MILPDHKLIEWAVAGGIDPYREEHINPASIDLCMGAEIIELKTGKWIFNGEDVTITPGNPILATTIEYIKMPLDCAGVLYLKSSLARQGLDHALAGFVDPYFMGTLTMELHAHRNIRIAGGQRVVQLVLYRLESLPKKGYQGRYQGQCGPTTARPELPGLPDSNKGDREWNQQNLKHL